MKRLFFLSIAAFLAISIGGITPSFAQCKIDVQGQTIINNYKQKERASSQQGMHVADRQSTTAIIKMSDNRALDEITSLGGKVLDTRFDMAIVNLPVSQLERISRFSEIQFISTQKKVSIMNNMAREASGVDAIRAGVVDKDGIPLGYAVDGTGVVVGLMDTGLDPNHINFFDENGVSRVKGITCFTGSSGDSKKYTTPEEIANFTTETTAQTHGTHVLGTLAGSYKGGEYDYSGVATGSEIYVSCGALYDSNILLGVRDILEYAKSVNKPAIVNLSLGNTAGSHDEYAFFSQYLDYYVNSYTPCPFIVISAGNDAKKSIAIKKTFTDDVNSFSTVMAFNQTVSSTFNGSLDIYGDDSTPFTLRPFIYDKTSKVVVATLDAMNVTASGFNKTFYCYETFDEEPIPELAEYFTGSIGIQSAVDSNSGRFYISFAPNLKARTSTRYCFGFTVEGSAGHTVYAYHHSSNGTTFSNGGKDDFTAGTADGTVNGLACGRRVAVIGSYNTRRDWPNYEGEIYGYYSNAAYGVGLISDFSSWATLWDGRNLPNFVAPGSMISSSLNAYNIESTARDVPETNTTVMLNIAGRNQYWGVMRGTSMASPFAAGVFALWKQVNPDLTIEDAVWIAQETAMTDGYVTNAGVQAGGGKLNADAGLQMVLSGASVESVLANGGTPYLVKSLADNLFEIRSASDADFIAEVYSTVGQKSYSIKSNNGIATINGNALAKGVYVISIRGGSFVGSTKIVVK